MKKNAQPAKLSFFGWRELALRRKKFPSPLRLALLLIFTVGGGEAVIMYSLPYLNMSRGQEIIYDATVLILFSLPVVYFYVYRPLVLQIREQKRVESEREAVILELQQALDEVKTLRGLLPICAWCKNIRDAQGEWRTLEEYISTNSDAEFTHSICPHCYHEVMSRQAGSDSPSVKLKL